MKIVENCYHRKSYIIKNRTNIYGENGVYRLLWHSEWPGVPDPDEQKLLLGALAGAARKVLSNRACRERFWKARHTRGCHTGFQTSLLGY